jgi:hypothetical protein
VYDWHGSAVSLLSIRGFLQQMACGDGVAVLSLDWNLNYQVEAEICIQSWCSPGG